MAFAALAFGVAPVRRTVPTSAPTRMLAPFDRKISIWTRRCAPPTTPPAPGADDGTVAHELAEPLKILLDPGLPDRLAALGNRNWTARYKGTGYPEIPGAAGSNIDILLDTSGFEPPQPAYSPAR
jgi:hypothetical protein